MTTHVTSPLRASSAVNIVRRLCTASIVNAWRNTGYDVSHYFASISEILLLECATSRLQFYAPAGLAADAGLYAFLGNSSWYYDPHKWELPYVVEALRATGARSVLEVGCGSGHFLALARDAGISAVGVDINVDAIAAAQSKGLHASTRTLNELLNSGERYDAVVAFQVLEHIPRPHDFLTEVAALVEDGGSLFFAVPNADCWISRRLSLLDTPPHHMTRWPVAAFQHLTQLLPFTLADVAYEQMTTGHLNAWALSLCDPDPSTSDKSTVIGRRAPLIRRIAARLIAALFRLPGMPLPAVGPTLVVKLLRQRS